MESTERYHGVMQTSRIEVRQFILYFDPVKF